MSVVSNTGSLPFTVSMTKHFLTIDGLVEYNRKLRFHNKNAASYPTISLKNAIKILSFFVEISVSDSLVKTIMMIVSF